MHSQTQPFTQLDIYIRLGVFVLQWAVSLRQNAIARAKLWRGDGAVNWANHLCAVRGTACHPAHTSFHG
jgi:hypothetical protein